MANERGRQKKCVKIFLNFTYLHKRNNDKKLQEISRIFLKMSTHQMFGYPGLDAGFKYLTAWWRYSVFREAKSAETCKALFKPLQVR